MTGDGVSLQTNLVQAGKVAKSQSQSQHSGSTGPGFAQELDKREANPVKRVQEASKSDRKDVEPEGRRQRGEDADQEDERERERERKRRLLAAGDEAAAADPEAEPPSGLGDLIDTKA